MKTLNKQEVCDVSGGGMVEDNAIWQWAMDILRNPPSFPTPDPFIF